MADKNRWISFTDLDTGAEAGVGNPPGGGWSWIGHLAPPRWGHRGVPAACRRRRTHRCVELRPRPEIERVGIRISHPASSSFTSSSLVGWYSLFIDSVLK